MPRALLDVSTLVSSTLVSSKPARIALAMTILLALPTAPRAAAEEALDRVHINAHMTQAWGATDGVSFLGLDEDGTFDYRTGALLLRFDVSEKSSLVLQLAHEELGGSPGDQFRDPIDVDWLFFQRRWDTGTRVRVGRLPIPYGIYNDLRDVGTVLEFYRPPTSIYLESSFAAETLDGLQVTQRIGNDRWPIEIDLYLGAWDRLETVATQVAEGRAEEAIGTQIWVGTPVSGLRFGLAYQTFKMEGGLIPRLRIEDSTFTNILASVDGEFDRFKFRAEYQETETDFVFADSFQRSIYALLGFNLHEKLSLNLLREDSDIEFSGGPLPVPDAPYLDDWAVSINYKFSPQAVLKAEFHQANITGSIADELLPTRSFHEVNFGILSFSASF